MHAGTGSSVTPAFLGNPAGNPNYLFAYGVAGSAGSTHDAASMAIGSSAAGNGCIATFLPYPGTNTSPAWAASYDTTAVAGTGTWVNPANAEGTGTSPYATWTAP